MYDVWGGDGEVSCTTINMTNEKKPRVLLVDDDSFLLNLYSLKFRKSGFEADVAVGGAEALALLRGGVRPDVIMVDMVMPTMDGLELLAQIKKENLAPDARFIVLSNQGNPSDIERAKKLNVAGYIVKASSVPTEVVEEVEKIIGIRPDAPKAAEGEDVVLEK